MCCIFLYYGLICAIQDLFKTGFRCISKIYKFYYYSSIEIIIFCQCKNIIRHFIIKYLSIKLVHAICFSTYIIILYTVNMGCRRSWVHINQAIMQKYVKIAFCQKKILIKEYGTK